MSDPIVISVDLGTGSRGRSAKSKGAWDDGELVRAYDAALEEFHVHHPGPGTWLDKATAAAAQGQPLAGAKAFGTDWYNASGSSSGQGKRKAETIPIDDNPYSAPIIKRKTKRDSPSFVPPSPTSEKADDNATMSIQSASRTTYDEAITYAMSAQYAAGYWLGVAHTKAAGVTKDESNIIHTRREFTTKLKR